MPYQQDLREQLTQVQEMGNRATDFAAQITSAKKQHADQLAAKKQAELETKAQQEWQKKQAAALAKAQNEAAKAGRKQAKQLADFTRRQAQLQKQLAERTRTVGGGNYGSGKAPPATGSGKSVLDIAASLKGIPYKWGGNTPASGMDCSGYVKYVYGKLGVNLPRTSATQAAALPRVDPKSAVPGDLVFFATNGRVHHVGIYAGNGMMWNSPKTGSHVRLQKVWRTSDTITYGRPPSPKSNKRVKANAYAMSMMAKMGT